MRQAVAATDALDRAKWVRAALAWRDLAGNQTRADAKWAASYVEPRLFRECVSLGGRIASISALHLVSLIQQTKLEKRKF
jgi:hypothetical protein